MFRIRDNPAPLFPLLACIIAGIICGRFFLGFGSSLLFCAGIFFLAASAVLFIVNKFKKISVYLFFGSLLFFSAFRYIQTSVPAVDDIYQLLPFKGEVIGKVLLPVRQLTVRVKTAVISGKVYRVKGNVAVRWHGEKPPAGSTIKIKGEFSFPAAGENPALFSWKRHLADQKIFTQAFARELNIIKRDPVLGVLGTLRRYIETRIEQYFPEKEAGMLKGMMLGIPGTVSQDILEKFRMTGVMHLLAVSGLHTGLILFSFYYILSVFLKRNTSLLISLAAMSIYIIITGARPSAVRAGIMLSVMTIGSIMGERGNIYNSLCFAGILILAISPGLLFTPGFQLSFLALGGICYLSPLFKKYTGLPFAVSFSAVLGIAPVLAWNFFYIPFAAPVTNLLVVPAAGLSVSLTLVFLLFSGFSSFLGHIYSFSVLFLLKFINLVTDIMNNSGFSGSSVPRPAKEKFCFFN